MTSVAPEPVEAPDSLSLRRDLAADLMERNAADAEPGFKPSGWDVAVFLMARAASASRGPRTLRALRSDEDSYVVVKKLPRETRARLGWSATGQEGRS